MSIAFGFSVPNEPGVYVEVDGSRSGVTGTRKSKVLVFGQRLSTETTLANVAKFVPSIAAAKAYYGRGSILARTIELLKLAYPGGEVWAIEQDDDVAGVAASGTIATTVAGTAGSGTIYLYICGFLLKVGVTEGDTPTDIATAIAAAINAASDLPVTATANVGAVTVTCRHKGLAGNEIDIRLNYRGESAKETLPPNVSIEIVPMANGTTEPDLDDSIAAMGDTEYDTIVFPYTTSTSLTALKAAMASRWSATRMRYGHAFGSVSTSYSGAVAYGSTTTQNDEHATILPVYNSPSPPWEWAAAFGALAAEHLMDADDAQLSQGFTGLKLYGVLPPPLGDEFDVTDRDILLSYGLSTFTVSGGSCYLSMPRTTYRVDESGTLDGAYEDTRTLAILQRIIRNDRAEFMRRISGAVLVDDATRVGGGVKVCSPALARGFFAKQYADYETKGLVTDSDEFLTELLIELNGSSPRRMDILYPPHISRWLAVAAIKLQPRLI